MPLTKINRTETDWLQPPAEHRGLRAYLDVVRERILLVVLAVLITTAVAIVYVATAEKVYQAEVEIRLDPVSDQDGALVGLGLITQSSDPQRAVQTAVTLIESRAAAEIAAEELGLDRQPESVLRDIDADPVAESDIISVTAEASTADDAAALANAFAEAAIRHRSDVLHENLDDRIRTLETQADTSVSETEQALLLDQISLLRGLRSTNDPTLELVEAANPPNGPASPKRTASIAGGLLAGLLLGIGAAFALHAFDPRLRREQQLRERYGLPILARIPRETGRRRQRRLPLTREDLSNAAVEAYRMLRAILARSLSRGGQAASILVTSAGPSEGKTTTAINLATSLAVAGHRVILIEADLRRPMIAEAVGVKANHGIIKVLIEEATLRESLIPLPGEPNVQLLVAEQDVAWGSDLLSLQVGERLIAHAKQLADYVIIDSPPLATVVDALPLARAVDDVLLVARIGVSRTDGIQKLAEILADAGIKPTGFAVLGTPVEAGGGYYTDQRRAVTERPAAVARAWPE